MTYPVHSPYHERRLEQQHLDALLRIEEILARAFPDPTKEPATKTVDAPKGKRK